MAEETTTWQLLGVAEHLREDDYTLSAWLGDDPLTWRVGIGRPLTLVDYMRTCIRSCFPDEHDVTFRLDHHGVPLLRASMDSDVPVVALESPRFIAKWLDVDTLCDSDAFELMWYSIGEDGDGGKTLRYRSSASINTHSWPDDVDPDVWDGTPSVERYEMPPDATIPLGDVVASSAPWSLFTRLEDSNYLFETYHDTIAQGLEYLKLMSGAEHLDITQLTTDTPCGSYWSQGFWVCQRQALAAEQARLQAEVEAHAQAVNGLCRWF